MYASANSTALRRWTLVASINGAGRQRPVGTFAKVLRATIHIQAGEAGGAQLAYDAAGEVARLRSQRARERLLPLIEALESRSSSDAREVARVARVARQVMSAIYAIY